MRVKNTQYAKCWKIRKKKYAAYGVTYTDDTEGIAGVFSETAVIFSGHAHERWGESAGAETETVAPEFGICILSYNF